MKIILSPAKSLDFDTKAPTTKSSKCIFLEQSSILSNHLKEISATELSKLMKISDDLGRLNYARNQEWEIPFDKKNTKQAVFAFTGAAYKGLDPETLDFDEIDTLQDKLRILSGLYGLLKPLDLIMPYRLEMGTKLTSDKGTTLYKFWGNTLVESLNNEMKSDEILINLASNEYSKAIPKKELKPTLITPVFKELKGETYKVVSFYAKKARGLMVRYIIENDIDSIDELKNFNLNNYGFSEALSSESELVFTR